MKFFLPRLSVPLSRSYHRFKNGFKNLQPHPHQKKTFDEHIASEKLKFTYTFTFAYTSMYARSYIHTQIHSYTHTYIHTYIHTPNMHLKTNVHTIYIMIVELLFVHCITKNRHTLFFKNNSRIKMMLETH